jgi:hypothetical protein
LQRRLNALAPRVELQETQIANVLDALRRPLGLPEDVRGHYRRFETGLATRETVLSAMVETGLLTQPKAILSDQICASVETFHAFMAAFVASLHAAGLTHERPPHYRDIDGWVHLPRLDDWTPRVTPER